MILLHLHPLCSRVSRFCILNLTSIAATIFLLYPLYVRCYQILPYKLEIKAPALEYLNFGGHLDSILLEDLSNLVEAVIDIDVDLTKIDYYEHYGSRVWDFIGELGDIKSLHLSANTTEFLCNASEFDPPMFHNLSFLKVKGPCMLHVLPHLLQVTPNLAVLLVEKEERNFFSREKEESFTCDMIIYEEPLQQVVRKCLSSCLTTLHYKGFEGLKNELKLVEHFLKRAKVLKTMKISSYNLNEALCSQGIIVVSQAF